SLCIAAENAHEYLRVTKVAGDIDAGNGDEADDAGILDAFSEEGRHFFSDRFGNAVRATGIVRHRLRIPSLDQRTPRSRTAGPIGRARGAVKIGRHRGKEKARVPGRGWCRRPGVAISS